MWNPPDSVLEAVLGLVIVGGVLETLGLLLYLTTFHEAAFEAFLDSAITPVAFVEFMLASPDRLLVAVGLAILAVIFNVTGTGGKTRG